MRWSAKQIIQHVCANRAGQVQHAGAADGFPKTRLGGERGIVVIEVDPHFHGADGLDAM